MVSEHSREVARRGEQFYEEKLRKDLEAKYPNKFVAVEPDSGEYFVGDTLSSAIQAARAAYPDRIAYALRVGHPAAVHLGVMAT